MTAIRTISPVTARRLAISSQHLAGERPTASQDGLYNLISHLNCVQIDPIRAVERTQLLVLWSRLGSYDPSILDTLLWQERRLFEYWAHCASIVLTEDYPLYRLHMDNWLNGDKAWTKRTQTWMDDNNKLRQTILDALTENGPLSSRDFKDRSQRSWQSSGWTSGQNVGLMLNALWRLGIIMVSHRKGLTKFWDLSDRCLPDWTPHQELDWPEAVKSAAQRSLRALGLARPVHIEQHFTRGRYPDLKNILKTLESEGQVIQVQIVDQGQPWPGTWYVHGADLPLLDRLQTGEWQPRTVLLSPFDNLICDRDRTEVLFDFHFRIEIYVPKAKRQYGYYVMPVLFDDALIGRLDIKMDRKQQQLQVNAVYAEPEAPQDVGTGRAVAGTVEDLAGFLGAKEIIYGQVQPAGWAPAFT